MLVIRDLAVVVLLSQRETIRSQQMDGVVPAEQKVAEKQMVEVPVKRSWRAKLSSHDQDPAGVVANS